MEHENNEDPEKSSRKCQSQIAKYIKRDLPFAFASPDHGEAARHCPRISPTWCKPGPCLRWTDIGDWFRGAAVVFSVELHVNDRVSWRTAGNLAENIDYTAQVLSIDGLRNRVCDELSQGSKLHQLALLTNHIQFFQVIGR